MLFRNGNELLRTRKIPPRSTPTQQRFSADPPSTVQFYDRHVCKREFSAADGSIKLRNHSGTLPKHRYQQHSDQGTDYSTKGCGKPCDGQPGSPHRTYRHRRDGSVVIGRREPDGADLLVTNPLHLAQLLVKSGELPHIGLATRQNDTAGRDRHQRDGDFAGFTSRIQNEVRKGKARVAATLFRDHKK